MPKTVTLADADHVPSESDVKTYSVAVQDGDAVCNMAVLETRYFCFCQDHHTSHVGIVVDSRQMGHKTAEMVKFMGLQELLPPLLCMSLGTRLLRDAFGAIPDDIKQSPDWPEVRAGMRAVAEDLMKLCKDN